MVSLSPLFANIGALLDGLVTVRGKAPGNHDVFQIAYGSAAFGMQARFQDRVIAVTDIFQRMDHFYWYV